MNKARIDAVSDGVFAIVMTLLVIEIKVPKLEDFSELGLWVEIQHLAPLFFSYFLSFALLSSYYSLHTFLISYMARTINRNLMYLNFIFLSFISLIPFSASLLGEYRHSQVAVTIYALHILLLALLLYVLREYINRSPNIENPEDYKKRFTAKDRFYGTSRLVIAVGFSTLAVLFSFVNTDISLIFILSQIILSTVPGLLGTILNITKIDKLAQEVEKEVVSDAKAIEESVSDLIKK